MATEISQAAGSLGTFVWTEADPVSLTWLIDADWSGTYICQIRKLHKATAALVGTLTVVAEWDTIAYPGKTLFTMTMSQPNSALIPAGNYFCDGQQVGGVTRFWAKVKVEPQVTV